MKALNTMILSMMLAASEAIAANGPYFLEATMTPADGIVKRGESVALTYKLQKDGQPAVGEKLRITLKWEGQVVKQETVETTADTEPPLRTAWTPVKSGPHSSTHSSAAWIP